MNLKSVEMFTILGYVDSYDEMGEAHARPAIRSDFACFYCDSGLLTTEFLLLKCRSDQNINLMRTGLITSTDFKYVRKQ